jgi:hypothetical protein
MHQQGCWCCHHRLYRLLWVVLLLRCFGTPLEPASPYQTLVWRPTFTLIQKFRRHYFRDRFLRNPRTHTSIEAYQEELAMEDTEERKKRDVRAIRWLVDKAAVNAEMEPFVLAIPGTITTTGAEKYG